MILSVTGLGISRDPVDLVSSGLFLTNEYLVFIGSWGSSFNQAWSLAVEEQFYLLAAPLLLSIRPGLAWPLCATTASVGAAWYLWLCFGFPKSMAPGLDSIANFTFIAIGGLIALRHRPSSPAVARWMQPLLMLGLLLTPFIPIGAHTLVIRLVAQPVLVAMLLGELRDHRDTRVSRVLGTPMLVYLGGISYGLYLLHQFISANLLRDYTAGLVDITEWTPMQQFFPLLLASIGVATCSWRWLERPIITRAARKHLRQTAVSRHDTACAA